MAYETIVEDGMDEGGLRTLQAAGLKLRTGVYY